MPPLPLLYNYRRCPYAMRARMAILQAGREFQVFEVALRDKPEALLALSPKGTVPVLQLPDGQVLDQSWDIMRWALDGGGGDGDANEAWWRLAQSPVNLELLDRNDGEFKHHLDRYKYPERYPDEGLARDGHRAHAMSEFLQPLQERLQHQAYLGGELPCATDIAIFPFVRQFAAVEPAWFASQPLPALQVWLTRWLSSHLFETCMAKLPSQALSSFPMLAIEGGTA